MPPLDGVSILVGILTGILVVAIAGLPLLFAIREIQRRVSIIAAQKGCYFKPWTPKTTDKPNA